MATSVISLEIIGNQQNVYNFLDNFVREGDVQFEQICPLDSRDRDQIWGDAKYTLVDQIEFDDSDFNEIAISMCI